MVILMKIDRENKFCPDEDYNNANRLIADDRTSCSGLDCPSCGHELDHKYTFVNIDYCLDAIGHPRDAYSRRKPVKVGDIYFCQECDEWWHAFDCDGELRYGYP